MSPSMPDTSSLTALRAWYAGMASRDAVVRYCPDVLGEGRSARGALSRIRRQIAGFALSRHRNYLAALFQCAAGERTRHAKAVARAVEILRALPVPQPQVSDPIDLWLPARPVAALRHYGISTLADLTARIPWRRRWWTVIPGLGVRSARQIEGFFASHPKLTERARALVAVASPELITPWERIHLPHKVDGSRGIYRAPRQMCTLEAGNDYEAIGAWLALHEATETQRAYRREAERLLLWAILERGNALSSLATEDATAYWAFLRRPGPRDRWVAPARAALLARMASFYRRVVAAVDCLRAIGPRRDVPLAD